MTEKKTLCVIGATGATAGGLARAILADTDGGFALRAVTRTPGSPAARALAAAGATVVRADADDPESLAAAFAGAYGAFCMTTFWDHLSPERETARAANLARAAEEAGLQHTVWSTMEDTRRWFALDEDRMPTLMGRYKVPPFDAKADGDAFFSGATTRLLSPTHWDAFVFGKGAPQRGPDGALGIFMPLGNALLPGIAAEDIGRCAYAIFRDPDRWIGRTIGIAAEHLSGAQLAAGLSGLYGESVTYTHLPAQAMRSLPFPGIEIAANMFQFIAEVDEYRALRDVAATRSLHPKLLSYEDWLSTVRLPVPADPH